jgi:hypothetical protein
MFFFRKQKFFLDLSEAGSEQEKAAKGAEAKVTLAPPAAAPAKASAATTSPTAAPQAPAAPAPAAQAPLAPAASSPAPAPAPAVAAAADAAAPVRTTAEEIAAQLAAEAANRPAPTFSTFAPDCVVPGGATPRRRRKAGANLGPFKEMAKGMMKS